MAKIYIMIVVLGFVGGAIFGAKYYYDSTQAKIEQLSKENAILDTAVRTNESTIAAMAANNETQQKLNQELQGQLQQAEAGLDNIRKKLANYDLAKKMIEDPIDMEMRINRATERVFREIESDTNAEAQQIKENLNSQKPVTSTN